MKPLFAFLTACAILGADVFGATPDTGLQVGKLRCEYRVDPLGIDVVKPRFYWVIESAERGQRQTAYQVLVASSPEKLAAGQGDLWDSGRVESDETIHVVYAGKPLTSRMRCWWKVRVWDKDGKPSAWSESATWSMGLLKKDDWKAKWIADPKDEPASESGVMPATTLRKEFGVAGPVKRATVYVTGLGVYELRLNGKKVGDRLLAPEFTMYDHRVQYQTYDVTEQIVAGENAIGATLADGWNGEYFFGMPTRQFQRPFGGRRSLIGQLEIELADGTKQTIVTDGSWRSTRDGPMRAASLYDGERYDARKEMPGWDAAEFDDRFWRAAMVTKAFDDATLVWQPNEPIRIVKELKPVEMTEPKPNVWVMDFGQNMVGWCRMKVHGRAGTKVTLRHAEVLKEDGTIYMDNLRGATQTDTYIKGTDAVETYEPRFTYHGFRYVEITGNEYKPWVYMPPYRPKPNDLIGCVFHSASPDVGKFECSDELFNKIMHMIEWVQRGNMHSVPTDCPQRCERAGWMGDIQSFAQTGIFRMDMAAFLTKWLADVRDAQAEDGAYPNFAPMEHARWKGGTPAWADAGTIVPWRAYQNYADKRMLEVHYESAKRWVDRVHRKNPNLIWGNDLGYNFNDWLNADTLIKEGWPTKGGRVPPKVLSTSFFAKSTEIVGKMAAVLGHDEDAKKYSERAAAIREAFNKTFVDAEGRIAGNTQAGYALALRFNMLPDAVRPKAAKHMVDEFGRYNGHMSTGIQTSHRLMLELTRNGYHDEAYRLLSLRKIPSWGYMVDQGATTVWERWDAWVDGRGFQKPLMNSFNHWALGAVGEWMWRHIIGLNPDESQSGWKHFTIEPRPGGGLTWARGTYDSIRGTIASDWRIEDGRFHLNVTIPPNTTATVRVPAKDADSVTIDGQPAAVSKLVKSLGFANGKAAFQVPSGRYEFVSLLSPPK